MTVYLTLLITSFVLSLAGVSTWSPKLTPLHPPWTASGPAGPCLQAQMSRPGTRQERLLLMMWPPAAAAASRSQTSPPAPCHPLISTRSAMARAAPAQPARTRAFAPRPSPCCHRCAMMMTCSVTVGRFWQPPAAVTVPWRRDAKQLSFPQSCTLLKSPAVSHTWTQCPPLRWMIPAFTSVSLRMSCWKAASKSLMSHSEVRRMNWWAPGDLLLCPSISF